MNRLACAMLLGAAAMLSANTAAADDDHGPRHNQDCHFTSGMPGGFDNGASMETIAQVLKNAEDEEIVILKGKLTKSLGDEKFEFTDSKGDTIVVKLDDDENWSHLKKDMPIEIEAEVDKDFMSVELEVKCARPQGQSMAPDNAPKGF